MSITLSQIFSLVGRLDDTEGDGTPRERFRSFLKDNVREVGQARDYIEECLRGKGDQYNCALQDLVNYLGNFLGFEVKYGRYSGVQGQIGFDGHWESPTGFHVVVEVKTTEVYAIKTATLLQYINELVSEGMIHDRDFTLGLYVVGRPDPEIRQLENAIIAEKLAHQLRVISVESLISLAELMSEYDVGHKDILAILRPSGPHIDEIVGLMASLVAQRTAEEPVEKDLTEEEVEEETSYWLTPVKGGEDRTAEDEIKVLVGEDKIYAFGERTPGRRHLKPGDLICFYAVGNGIIAHAKVGSKPKKKKHPSVRESEKYPWVFSLGSTQLYLKEPVIIDAALRKSLDVFQGRDPDKPWAWFVQATRKLTEHDFLILTRHET